MSDLLNNDNITAYLFKKDNFKANTGLKDSGVAASEEKSLSSEQYGSSKIVLKSHIFSSDISFNLTADQHVDRLNDSSVWPTILDSSWNTVINDISAQTLYPQDLSDNNLRFYKGVYLEPVIPGNDHFWWLQIDRSNEELGKISNNLLSNTIPEGLGRQTTMYRPIVSFWNGPVPPASGGFWSAESFNTEPTSSVNTSNWTLDYGTGILALNVDNTTLKAAHPQIDSNNTTSPYARPRISFTKYVGQLGASGSGGGTGGGGTGGGGTGGGISDASYNELKDDIDLVNEKIDNYLFDIPEAVIGISHEEVIAAGETQVHITWTNPQQKCAAFDFYQILDDGSWANNLYQPYYVDANGLSTNSNDISIWQTIKRSMNKLPFYEFLRVQYLSFNPNTNFTPNAAGWQDLGNAQIVGGTGTTTSTTNGGRTLYPIFKDITKIVVSNDGQNSGSESITTGLTRQDILKPNSGPRCYTNKNVLDATKVYRFRVALDNRACLDGKEFGDPSRDISDNLNWQVVPSDGTFIELGSYGPAPAPSNIQFVTGEKPFEPTSSSTNYSGTITGSAGFDSNGTNQVMDLSFNTNFPGPSNIAVQYGFDVSGNILNSSKQVGSRSFTAPIPQQFRYANENSLTFTTLDLSFNTTPAFTTKGSVGITTASFNIDLDTTLSGWNKSTNFQTNFPHGIALPEHIYDISNVYMANNQFDPTGAPFPFKAVADKTGAGNYGGNFPQSSEFATRAETSSAVFGSNNLMEPITTETVSSVISTNPGYVINMTTPPNNYGTTSELKKVRQGNNHNVNYGIFIAPGTNVDISFNNGDYSSATNFTNKNVTNFITCPHGQNNSIKAGSDIINQQIASYDLKYEYRDNNNTPQAPITPAIQINGYNGTFPDILTSTNNLLNLIVENDDPTGNTSIGITRLNQQFGGYYNIQKILNATGINGIDTTNTGDTADSTYSKYILELRQSIPASVSDNSLLQQNKKTIEFYLGHAPTTDISLALPAPIVGIPTSPGIITNLSLFGLSMPNNSLNFELPSVQIIDINTKWIWADENLFDFKLFYNNGSTFDELDNVLVDWNNSVTTTQTNTFVGTESVGVTANFRQNYPYSRNGAEGSLTSSGGATSDGQFKITLIVKNNVFATTIVGSPTEFDFDYYSNEGNTKWNWAGNSHIIWWDYTYAALTTGTGITSGPDNKFEGFNLKDSRGIGTQTQTAGGNTYTRHWPGLNFTTSGAPTYSTLHEWYNNKYDHSHTANPPSLDNHQLIWADGAFRGGYSSGGTGSNVNNPYIDYNKYFRNSSNYSAQGSLGESWNYDATWSSNFAGGTYYDGSGNWSISGDYKFIMLEDDSQSWANNKSVEFYVNGTDKSDSLTLGTNYILYICLEGDAYNSSTYSSVSGRETFVDSGGNTKYRTGWFDCQLQAVTSNVTLDNGKGCFMASNSNVISSGIVSRYQFILYGLEINNGSDVNKIYYRLGIKNSPSPLSNSTYNSNNNSIKSISVEYSTEENQ